MGHSPFKNIDSFEAGQRILDLGSHRVQEKVKWVREARSSPSSIVLYYYILSSIRPWVQIPWPVKPYLHHRVITSRAPLLSAPQGGPTTPGASPFCCLVQQPSSVPWNASQCWCLRKPVFILRSRQHTYLDITPLAASPNTLTT